MAASTAEMRYAINGTYGSAAFDLNALPQEGFPEEIDNTSEESARRWARQNERAARRERAIEAAKNSQSVSIAAVAGFAVVALLIVMVLLSYVRLAEISADVTRLKSSITALESTQTKLSVEYEQVFNLNEIKEYATGTLGMTKLNDSNTLVFTIERQDRAQVLAQDDSRGLAVIAAAREFISSLAEYLR